MYKSLISVSVALAISVPAIALDGVSMQPAEGISPELTNIHNRCIVRLHDDVAGYEVESRAQGMLARANAMIQSTAATGVGSPAVSIQHLYQYSIKGFTLDIPCKAAENAFGDEESIKSFSPDSIVSINKGKPVKDDSTEAQKVSYGTTRVGGPIDGTSRTAWIIDTGIDLDHADLNVDSSLGFTAISRGGMEDQNGHGTHVAGIIGAIDNSIGALGVAPNTTVIPVRVLDRRGSGSLSGVIAGVDHVANNANPGDCANMSLGAGVSQDLDDAVVAASQVSGAFFVLAAGNSGDDANNYSPARANDFNVWTISAIDSSDNMPSWSNWGNPPIDFAAPGVGIFSLWKDGGTKTISGTSMSSPHACAVIMMTSGSPNVDGTAKNDPDGNPDPIIHF